jgi:hypothetical protein
MYKNEETPVIYCIFLYILAGRTDSGRMCIPVSCRTRNSRTLLSSK